MKGGGGNESFDYNLKDGMDTDGVCSRTLLTIAVVDN